MILSLCAALCELRDADSLQGVMDWSTRALAEVHQTLKHDATAAATRPASAPVSGQVLLPWIQPLLLEAQGHYEEAVALYQQVGQRGPAHLDPPCVSLLI